MLKEFFHKSMNEDLDDYEASDIISKDDIKQLIEEMMDYYMDEENEDAISLLDAMDEIVELLDGQALNVIYYELAEAFLGDEDDEDEMDEGMSAKKVKVKASVKLARKKSYKRNKQKIKKKAKKFRKSAAFRKYKKKSKRMSAKGKTSTGKRKTKFL